MQALRMATNNVVPISAEAELTLCGLLLQSAEKLPAVRQIVSPDHMLDPACRAIYQAIIDCHEVYGETDVLAVAEHLDRSGRLEDAGGFPTLVHLSQQSVGSAETAARIVRKHSQRLFLERVGLRMADVAAKTLTEPSDIASLAVERLQELAQGARAAEPLLLGIEALHARYAAQEWACKSVIPANAVGVFFGASGTFKSFVALDYALHRCYGLPWLGRKTMPGVPVYLAAEGGAGIMARIEAWHRMRNRDWHQCPMQVCRVPMDLRTDAKRLRAAIEALRITPSDVIVDTMSQTYGGEENSASEVSAYLRALSEHLRAPWGATVSVVHHTGHSAHERPRGSAAIGANADFMFGCWRDEKEMVATVECMKQKDGERWPAVSFVLNRVSLGHDADGDEMSSLVARHTTDAQEIAQAAAAGPSPSSLSRLLAAVGSGAPEREVRERFYESMPDAEQDARRQAYFRALKRAEGQGMVVRQGDWLDLRSAKKGGGNA